MEYYQRVHNPFVLEKKIYWYLEWGHIAILHYFNKR